MKVYNKLVRDKIPETIKNNNQTGMFRVLDDEEYLVELNKKLNEELKEYLEAGDIEELADLEEVVRAIAKAKGYSLKQFNEIRNNKVKKRGAFKKKLFLESVVDN